MEVDPDELVDPFADVQPGDAQRDAIRVGNELGGAPIDLSAEQLAEQVEGIKLAAIRSEPRDVAIGRGRLAGADEADKRGEVGQERDLRIRRAQAYAAWEYDGKPLAYADRYQKEFKLGVIGQLYDALQHSGPDLKRGKK